MIIHNGNTYVRVSTIIKPFNNYAFADDEKMQNKQRIGNNVHAAIDAYLKNEAPYLSNADELGYFDSFLTWEKEVSLQILNKEKRYFDDKLMITGKVDGTALIHGEKEPILIDYKCAAQEMDGWRMQAHLYYHLLQVNGFRLSPRALVIKLCPKGKVPTAYNYAIHTNMMAKCYNAVESYFNKSRSNRFKPSRN